MKHEPFSCDNGPDCWECAEVRHAEYNLAAFQDVIDAACEAEKSLDAVARIPDELDERDCSCDLDPSGDAVSDMRATLDAVNRGLRDLVRLAGTEKSRIREHL